MDLKEKKQVIKEKWIERAYNTVTAPKTIKIFGLGAIGLYLGLLGVAVLVAVITRPPYTIWDNWISDLGSSNHTALPIFYDLACIFAGTLTIPFHFYLERYLAPIPRTPEELPAPNRWSYRLMSLGFFFSMLGSIFYIGVGIWSGDRATMGDVNMHGICSGGAFIGFAFAATFVGIALTVSDRKVVPSPFNYILGAYGVYGPMAVIMLNAFWMLDVREFTQVTGPFLEWLLLFSILIWIIPLALFALNHAKKVEHGEA